VLCKLTAYLYLYVVEDTCRYNCTAINTRHQSDDHCMELCGKTWIPCYWTSVYSFETKAVSLIRAFFNWYSGGWIPVGSTRQCGHQWPIVPAPGNYDDGEIGGMIGRRNRSNRRKLAPVPLCPPQTSYADWTWTRAAAVGSQRVTAWGTARPNPGLLNGVCSTPQDRNVIMCLPTNNMLDTVRCTDVYLVFTVFRDFR
jgi:hypothetical protein